MDRIEFHKLNPVSVIHPSDSSVIKWVDKLPGFKGLLENTVNKYVSVQADIRFVGNGYVVTPDNSKELYERFVYDCKVLGKQDIPELSVLWNYIISSLSIGFSKSERIVLSTGAVDLLENEELDFLIGHELGHIMTGHKPYHTFVEAICDPMFSINRVYMHIVKLPLLEWYRKSHFTADRMGLLCCQDVNVALSALIKMAGLPTKYYDRIDIEGFMEQAKEFEDLHSGAWDKVVKFFSVRSANAPWMVKRAKELVEWYHSDEYKRIIENA